MKKIAKYNCSPYDLLFQKVVKKQMDGIKNAIIVPVKEPRKPSQTVTSG